MASKSFSALHSIWTDGGFIIFEFIVIRLRFEDDFGFGLRCEIRLC